MKNIKSYTWAVLAGLAIASCGKKEGLDATTTTDTLKATPTEETTAATVWNVNLESRSGSNVTGTATFTEKDGQVNLHVMVKGLTPGKHGIHIHESADCSAEDGSSAGGHWNPTHTEHGEWGSEKFHRGDIGNLVADANGEAHLEMSTDLWCLTCEDPTKNVEGKSLIIHEKADDLTTQPTGDAGGRQACGGIIKG